MKRRAEPSRNRDIIELKLRAASRAATTSSSMNVDIRPPGRIDPPYDLHRMSSCVMSGALSQAPSEVVSIVDCIVAELCTPAHVPAEPPTVGRSTTPVAGGARPGAMTRDAESVAAASCRGQTTIPDEGQPA